MSETTAAQPTVADMAQAAEALAPLAESAFATAAMAASGDFSGALSAGVKTAEAAAALSPTVMPVVAAVAERAVDAAHDVSSHAVAEVTAHVMTGGMLAMIEHEIGTELPDLLRGRLGAMLRGFVHAAAKFGLG